MVSENRLPIQYSCYHTRSREGEQFVPEHALGYILSGAMELNDGRQSFTFTEGDIYFFSRNQLAKFVKYPPEGKEFRSLSIYFEQDTLRNFSLETGCKMDQHVIAPPFKNLSGGRVLTDFMKSLLAYEHLFKQGKMEDLLRVKQKEALLVLLQIDPDLKNILFDFSEPGKIDLEAYMNKNYHFNVELKRFAYLTGRSLSTFKRDFEKVFHMSPSRWLLQRRLQEAYYLLKEKKRTVSDVYLDLGFEDLSHFSFVFKKQYGVAPSLIQ